jgi:O-antigen/teichoic acid export membrane protein
MPPRSTYRIVRVAFRNAGRLRGAAVLDETARHRPDTRAVPMVSNDRDRAAETQPETQPGVSDWASPDAPSLRRSTVANLAGLALPLLVALFAMPVLTRGLGTDRFGVLTLAWVVLGYFSLFDFGLGRAMTKLVAEKIGLGEEEAIPTLVWTSLALMAVLGLVGAVLAFAISPWLVYDILRIPDRLEAESLRSFYLLAVSIPIVTSTAGLRGVLEATQRFDLVNAVRIPLGAFTFLGPVAVLPFSRSLVPIVLVLLLGRAVAWAAHLLLCFRVLPTLRSRPILDLVSAVPLLRFGGWISVSNIIGPLMVTLDRFVIGAMVSVSAVAYYTAPYEVVTKLWMIPAALTSVLFPAFAAAWVRDQARAAHLFRQAVKYTFLLVFPVTLVIVTLGHEGLTLWLGSQYAEKSTRVLQWLAIGVFLNCLAQMPFALIQAAGRPDLTAKLHVAELPFYLISLWLMLRAFGIEGAAIAWAVRCLADSAALFAIARHLVSSDALMLGRPILGLLAAVASVSIALFPLPLPARAALLTIGVLLFGLITWARLLAPQERTKLRAYAKW